MAKNISISEKLLKALDVRKSKPNESYEEIIWDLLDKLKENDTKNLVTDNKSLRLFFTKYKSLDDIFGTPSP